MAGMLTSVNRWRRLKRGIQTGGIYADQDRVVGKADFRMRSGRAAKIVSSS